MTEFECNLFENVVHFRGSPRKECFATRNVSQLVESALAFLVHLAAGIAAAEDSDSVKHYI